VQPRSVPARNGCATESPAGRQSTCCPLTPGLAALVALLLVAEAGAEVAETAPVVAAELVGEPAPFEARLPPAPVRVAAGEPPLAAASPASFADPPALAGAAGALVAIPSTVAPLPGPPAAAAPVPDPPPAVAEGETTPTVGVLVSVAPDTTVADAFPVVPFGVASVSAGSVTTPLPP